MRFTLVGVLNTLIDYSVFYCLFSVLGFHFLLSHICGFLVALSNGFYFNATWTFKRLDKECWRQQAVRYFVIGVIGMGLSTLTIYIGNFFMWVYLAKLLATVVSFLWNYSASSLFVFKKKTS